MTIPLQTYRANRAALLATLTQTLLNDERCVAAWLTGSWGRHEADALSDFDLSVVISAEASTTLCARPTLCAGQTTPERLALFSQFGQPLALHENHHNAPPGGTFTFVLYPGAFVVDWTLIPQAQAQRPVPTQVLFDKVQIPVSPAAEPESLAQRATQASNTLAFFWMMAVVTAKYIVRGDAVFVAHGLEELQKMTHEIARLVAGKAWHYRRGSHTQLQPTRADQTRALLHNCHEIIALMPQVAALGGYVPAAPLSAIETLLNL